MKRTRMDYCQAIPKFVDEIRYRRRYARDSSPVAARDCHPTCDNCKKWANYDAYCLDNVSPLFAAMMKQDYASVELLLTLPGMDPSISGASTGMSANECV